MQTQRDILEVCTKSACFRQKIMALLEFYIANACSQGWAFGQGLKAVFPILRLSICRLRAHELKACTSETTPHSHEYVLL
ncbi:hypothetical protein [Ruminococcus sp.]|uniref:hypothetical protein n=1 Tax=Ruminococcus sp. TaxID=41978 RepID=UPI000E4A7E2D|nr:hypothetical protein DWY44_01925 [Ruminococcus sp. AF25-19]